MSDWFDKEVEALDEQLRAGDITYQEYRQAIREMRRDAEEEDYRNDMRAAGRGHLLRP